MAESKQAEKQPQFRVVSQYIQDLSFECPKAPAFVKSTKQDLGLQVTVQARDLDEDHQEVLVKLRGESKGEKEETIFMVEVAYAGVFLLKDIPEQQKGPLLGIEAPALLFPFARQILMGTVASSGFRAPVIEPINFHGLYVQQQQQAAAKQATKAAEAPAAKPKKAASK